MYKTARGASGVEAKDQQQGINQGRPANPITRGLANWGEWVEDRILYSNGNIQ